MKKLFSVVLAAAMAASLAACGGSSAETTAAATTAAATEAATTAAAAAETKAEAETAAPAAGEVTADTAEYTIKVGHTLQENTPAHEGWLVFKDEVEKNSNGRIYVEIYPNSELGSERVMFEACQMGTLEIAYGTASVLANFDPLFSVLDMPFLFSGVEPAREALRGELGEKCAENLPEIELRKVMYMENGIRHVTNSQRPINTPDDLKGLKIRTMENSIHMSTFSHLGASPTPMAFTELFTALQQKTVDGEENPIFLIQTSRFDEVQKYLSLTGHFYTTGIATINESFYQSLPEDLQKVIMDAGAVAREAEYEKCDVQNASALETLKTTMEVNEITPENHQLFVEAAMPVYDEVRELLGDEIVDLALANAG